MGMLYTAVSWIATLLKPAYGRVSEFFQDKSILIIVVTFFTFSNFFTNLYAAAQNRQAGLVLTALESLAYTLGGSVNQMIAGLSGVMNYGFSWKGLLAVGTFILGVTTIYWWYRANSAFVQFMESTNPTIVHYMYMTVIWVLAVWLAGGQSQFFELVDLGGEAVTGLTDSTGVLPGSEGNLSQPDPGNLSNGSTEVNAS